MIEITMQSGNKYYTKTERKTEMYVVSDMEHIIVGSASPTIVAYEDTSLKTKVHLSISRIESFKILELQK